MPRFPGRHRWSQRPRPSDRCSQSHLGLERRTEAEHWNTSASARAQQAPSWGAPLQISEGRRTRPARAARACARAAGFPFWERHEDKQTTPCHSYVGRVVEQVVKLLFLLDLLLDVVLPVVQPPKSVDRLLIVRAHLDVILGRLCRTAHAGREQRLSGHWAGGVRIGRGWRSAELAHVAFHARPIGVGAAGEGARRARAARKAAVNSGHDRSSARGRRRRQNRFAQGSRPNERHCPRAVVHGSHGPRACTDTDTDTQIQISVSVSEGLCGPPVANSGCLRRVTVLSSPRFGTIREPRV